MRYGIDVVQDLPGRVAMITAPSGRTSDNRCSIDRLREVCDLRLLLGPEHGVRGDHGAGELYEGGMDPESGLMMKSLYTPGSKHLSEETLTMFDTLVYDIADVGCRYYTFISTLMNVMRDCAAAGKKLVVLDRPDPLGRKAEGWTLQPGNRSFVGCWEMPIRYGMTCGEFAGMINAEEDICCDLEVIPCEGWHGEMFPAWHRPWVMPSLGIPRFETALLYPGTCLFEGTNCSEGRGTADPFAIIGAPYLRAERLSRTFNNLHLPGVEATPVYFTPTASKHAGSLCGGVQLHVMDAEDLHPVETGLRLLELIRNEAPDDFAFLPPVREDGRPFISLLAGNRELEKPDWTADALLMRAKEDIAAFEERRRKYLLY